MKFKSQGKRSEFTLTTNQVDTLINGISNLRDRCMVKCLYYGGMRVSEVVNLKIEHVQFSEERILILESKFGKSRMIPFIDLGFMSDLKIYIDKRATGHVFLSQYNSPLTVRSVQLVTKKWAIRLGVKNPNPFMKSVNPHLFRHSIARHLKSAKYSAEFIQKFLGHSSIKTTMDEYGTLSFNEMQEIVYRRQNRKPIGSNKVEVIEDQRSRFI